MFARLMMITNNHIHTRLLQLPHLFNRCDAAIYCNHQLNLLFDRLIHSFLSKAIPLLESGRQKVGHRDLMTSQIGIHHGDRCRPIYIIIPINHHLLLFFDRTKQPPHSRLHIFHQKGVMPGRFFRTKIGSCLLKR